MHVERWPPVAVFFFAALVALLFYSAFLALLLLIGLALGNRCDVCRWPIACLHSGWTLLTGGSTTYFCVRCFKLVRRPWH